MSSIIQVHVKIYIDILYYSIYIYKEIYYQSSIRESTCSSTTLHQDLLPPCLSILPGGCSGWSTLRFNGYWALINYDTKVTACRACTMFFKNYWILLFFFVSSTIIFPFISGTRNTWHRILVSWLILQNSTETLRRGCKNLLDDTEVGGQLVCSPPIISLLPCLWSESKS